LVGRATNHDDKLRGPATEGIRVDQRADAGSNVGTALGRNKVNRISSDDFLSACFV
jgi:hypothetical protein